MATKNATTWLAWGAVTFLSTACGGIPLQGGADFQPERDFSQYSSYHWDEPDPMPTGDPRLDDNPFFIHRLHSAIHGQLATRGIRYQGPGPALAVHHHAVVREGTFLVDIADAGTNEIIWRGWARLDLDRALSDPEVMAEEIDRSIGKMFDSFPVPRSTVPMTEGR